MNKATIYSTDVDSFDHALRDLGDDSAVVFLRITRKEIETLNVGSAVERLLVISDSKAHTLKLRNSVHFAVDGWDEDPRELYTIPECIRYFRLVAQQWNYWLYFLDIANDSLGFFVRTQIDMEQVSSTNGMTAARLLDPTQPARVINHLFRGLHVLGKQHGIADEQMNAYAAQCDAALKRIFC